jgi:hypothetical protein
MRRTARAAALMMLAAGAVTSCGGASELTPAVEVPGRPAERPIEIAARVSVANDPAGPAITLTCIRSGAPMPHAQVILAPALSLNSIPPGPFFEATTELDGQAHVSVGDVRKEVYEGGFWVENNGQLRSQAFRAACVQERVLLSCAHHAASSISPMQRCSAQQMHEVSEAVSALRWTDAPAMEPVYREWASEALAQHERDVAQREGDLAATEADEIKTGRCEAHRAAKVQGLATSLGQFFNEGMSGGSDQFVIVDKKIVVATPAPGTAVGIDAKTGGDEHLYVIGFKPVRLALTDSTRYPVATKSPYEVVVGSASSRNIDSRNFRANVAEQLSAKITGSGCALVLLVKKL